MDRSLPARADQWAIGRSRGPAACAEPCRRCNSREGHTTLKPIFTVCSRAFHPQRSKHGMHGTRAETRQPSRAGAAPHGTIGDRAGTIGRQRHAVFGVYAAISVLSAHAAQVAPRAARAQGTNPKQAVARHNTPLRFVLATRHSTPSRARARRLDDIKRTRARLVGTSTVQQRCGYRSPYSSPRRRRSRRRSRAPRLSTSTASHAPCRREPATTPAWPGRPGRSTRS